MRKGSPTIRSNARQLPYRLLSLPPLDLEANEEALDALDALNKEIMEQMQAEGGAFVTNTSLAGRFVLRACILHYATTEQDIDAMLDAVRNIATRIRDGSSLSSG